MNTQGKFPNFETFVKEHLRNKASQLIKSKDVASIDLKDDSLLLTVRFTD